MREIDLTEYVESEPLSLSHDELVALQGRELAISVQPDSEEGKFSLKPTSVVGAVEIGDMSVLIRPKIGIPQVLSLACYAMSKFRLRREMFNYPSEYALPDVLALALTVAAGRAFSHGLLHDYLTREEALYTVRGRIRFDEQMRRRHGIALPIEVRYEEFTDDVLANRLVKAAVARLGSMRLREPRARRGLGWIAGVLDNVTLVEFPSRDVPEVSFSRLNEHYRGVVELSRLVLRYSAFESNRGEVRASGFLMDMNRVFQEFVTVALREELRLTANTFGERAIPSLDTNDQVDLRPDLVWKVGSSHLFVGDAKYKDITDKGARSDDLYQMLAYVTALDLPGGMLVYAEGEAKEVVHEVRHSGKRLEVATLDLSGALDEILDRVRCLAKKVRQLVREDSNPLSQPSGTIPTHAASMAPMSNPGP